ncbi:LAMI_0H16292g1_1 [Lachancea mirantina]|uniref:tRNA-splicing endonuclease subunit Sen2 n=1 Tax=Lachancea mirantina TaxID=1230905 RepID=A0A1G4KIZ5_9SACH|nr:LAMI_0H16292g1_1 [Lachancea mirantina]
MPKYVRDAYRYKYPLPIHPLDHLPPLIPHNPISWAYWLFCYLSGSNEPQVRVHAEMDDLKRVTVCREQDMRLLWDNGFFGTGRMSRSEATWRQRTAKRLGLESSERGLESVTEKRRQRRLQFKRERSKFEAAKLELRQKGDLACEILDQERLFLRSLRDKELAYDKDDDDVVFREIDHELLDDAGEVMPIEVLELMPVEAIFLSFALPVLDLQVPTLMSTLVSSNATFADIESLATKYVAYHHYRSRGWCVRSGVKFGCDFLLYRRGPPFQHAEFAVMVLNADETLDYTQYSSTARVVGGARKSFVVCYVERQVSERQILQFWQNHNYASAFSSFKIGEVTYRRWVPGKNRD